MPMMATANISAKTEKRFTTKLILQIKWVNLFTYKLPCNSLSRYAVLHSTYYDRSDSCEIIYFLSSKIPSALHNTLSSTRYETRRLDIETSCKITKPVRKVFYRTATYDHAYDLMISSNLCWLHWKLQSEPLCGETLN